MFGAPSPYVVAGTAGYTYGPLDFQYTASVPASGTNFVVSKSLGTLRNNFTGFVGMKITVGASPLAVSALGRFVVAGNTGSHTVKIADSTGADVAGTSVTIATAGKAAGSFAYGTLAAPVTLNAGGVYYIVSAETSGGDQWYDSNTFVTTTSSAQVMSGVFGAPSPYVVAGTAGYTYGPLDFQYTASAPASGTNFVVSKSLGTLRNNFTGFVGMKITVGSSPLVLSALGRFVVAGNSGSHTVKIADSTGADVAGASVTIATAGKAAGSFAYGALAAPVTLNAGGVYYIVSAETSGGDQWYDSNTFLTTTAAAQVMSGVWGAPSPYVVAGTAGYTYVPLDFQYTIGH